MPDTDADTVTPLERGPSIRVLPKLDDANRFFWTAGQHDELRFLRCQACRKYVHPPAPVCPYCLTGALEPERVSGRGILHSYTVNHQQWVPGSGPYIVGLVTIDEQDDVRLMTNIVECDVDDLEIGMAMEVVFERAEDVWLPLFRPAASGSGSASGSVPGSSAAAGGQS